MNKILVVRNVVPESLMAYEVTDPKFIELAKKCHNEYWNSGIKSSPETEILLQELNAHLDTLKSVYDDTELDSRPVTGHYDAVVFTGELL